MSHYLIATIQIDDRDRYGKYEEGFMDIFSKYGGTMLAVDEKPKLLEGVWSATRTVLIEFSSEQKAMDWYTSSEYQELAKHRFASSDGNIVLIQGLDQLPV